VRSSARGLVNLRDAGDLAGSASRLVRRGVLYRSDAPLPGDVQPAGLTWPPATVLDLRSAGERGDGEHPLAEDGARVVSLPLAGALAPEAQARLRAAEVSLPELYAALLDGAPRWLPTLLRVAGGEASPLLVHCAAGKDRTGVTVAILLALAAVPRAAIVADYLATNDVLVALEERMRTAHPHRPEVPTHLMDAPEAAIAGVLDRLGPDPAGWCQARGADPIDIARWQRRIWPGR
jgi:protein-tyrosine phosphatase